MPAPSLRLVPFAILAAALAFVAGPLVAEDIALPAPRGNQVAITRILAARHDTTAFSGASLPAQSIADLLWASTGVNRPTTGHRTANYSYAKRDNEVYLLCAQGVFLYDQLEHQLSRKSATDLRPSLGGSAATAPVTLVLVTYSDSPDFFGSIHTGFMAENIALVCADRGLGSHLAATIPDSLHSALGLAANRRILLLQSVGYPEGAIIPGPAWTVAEGALIPAAVNTSPALKILKRRRSSRNFASTPFSAQTLAELVWSGLGINNPDTGERTSPLVAGVHDIDLYLALATGIYRYRPGNGDAHLLAQVSTADIRGSLGYGSVPAIFIYVADHAKLPAGSNKERLACLHAGLVAQNVAAYAAAEQLGELVRSSVSIPTAALALTADQHILFTHTLGNMAAAPGKSTVTISAGTGGSVTGTTSQSIAFGGSGTPVTAVPASGFAFAYWSGLPGGRVPTNPLTLYDVTTAMNISAVFFADTVSSTYWRATNVTGADLTDETISGPNADPDSAGVTNLQRYAHNLPARGPAAAPVTLDPKEIGGKKYLALSFNRRAVAPGLTYVIEVSETLGAWTTLETVAPGAAPAPYVYTDAVAIPDSTAARRFLRVRLQYTP